MKIFRILFIYQYVSRQVNVNECVVGWQWWQCVAINLFQLNLHSFISFIKNMFNHFDRFVEIPEWKGANTKRRRRTNGIDLKQFQKYYYYFILIHNNKTITYIRFDSRSESFHILSLNYDFKLMNIVHTNEINCCKAFDKINFTIDSEICQTISSYKNKSNWLENQLTSGILLSQVG